jgi:hypothetical protein
MLKTTFDIPGKPFAEDNKHEWEGKQLLVARRTSHGDGEPTVFFEIASESHTCSSETPIRHVIKIGDSPVPRSSQILQTVFAKSLTQGNRQLN